MIPHLIVNNTTTTKSTPPRRLWNPNDSFPEKLRQLTHNMGVTENSDDKEQLEYIRQCFKMEREHIKLEKAKRKYNIEEDDDDDY